MRSPEIIFAIIVFLSIIYVSLEIWRYWKTKQKKRWGLKTSMVLITVLFSYIWFVPIPIKSIHEQSLCKFRFQVYHYDTDDYGGFGNFHDLILQYTLHNGSTKYGQMRFFKKTGGWQAYFGLEKSN